MKPYRCQKCGFEINFMDINLAQSHCDDFRLRVRKYWKPKDFTD